MDRLSHLTHRGGMEPYGTWRWDLNIIKGQFNITQVVKLSKQYLLDWLASIKDIIVGRDEKNSMTGEFRRTSLDALNASAREQSASLKARPMEFSLSTGRLKIILTEIKQKCCNWNHKSQWGVIASTTHVCRSSGHVALVDWLDHGKRWATKIVAFKWGAFFVLNVVSIT